MTCDEKCAEAVADQGLAPVLEALKKAGVPAFAQQTGGWCMVVQVNAENPATYVWITQSEECGCEEVEGCDHYILGIYHDGNGNECDKCGEECYGHDVDGSGEYYSFGASELVGAVKEVTA